MSIIGKKSLLIWSAVFAVLVTVVLSFALRTWADSAARIAVVNAEQTDQARSRARGRNLSLQPEAFRMSRRLGSRFVATGRDSSIVTGTLNIGTNQQSVSIVRRQTDRGETLEIGLGFTTLTWSDVEGAKASGGRPTEAQRLLIERLAFDSPDSFVLAQLRGASYYTVAQNVRPAEVGESDSYSGPLWDIVRVEDAERAIQKKPLSPWRLYYINSNTGLIDKIVSEFRGERIETVFSEWATVAGERVPSHIIWKRQDEPILEFILSSFTRVPTKSE